MGEGRDILTTEAITEIVSEAVSQALRSGLKDELREIKTAQELLNGRIERYIQMTENHDRLLRGNGKPGLMTLMEQMVPLVHEHQESLRGKDDNPGLVGRVKALESRTEGIVKPMWIVVTGVISTGIAVLVEHFVK